jgi:hypothetical protein
MADELIDERVPEPSTPDDERVRSRAAALAAETGADPDTAEAQAAAMLGYSDALQDDPAARTLDDDRVERRASEDTA